jgi:hypothetical protein
MNLITKLLIIFALFFANKVKAQLSLGIDGLDGIVGYQYQNYKTLELGIAFGTRGEGFGTFEYRNVHLCSEILLNDKGKNIFGLKAGLAYSFALVNGAAQFIYFSNFENSSFVFRPEIGLTYVGLFDLNIGRNIVMNSNDIMNLNSTVFILRFTYGKSRIHM